jgi:hypothetical protein
VRVIDDDLGVSGASVAGRSGFAELVAQVGLGQVGIVLSLECSRLARNNADWYRLLDLAGMADTLIADADGVTRNEASLGPPRCAAVLAARLRFHCGLGAVRRRPQDIVPDRAASLIDSILRQLTQGPAVMIGIPPPPAAPMSDRRSDRPCHSEVAGHQTTSLQMWSGQPEPTTERNLTHM